MFFVCQEPVLLKEPIFDSNPAPTSTKLCLSVFRVLGFRVSGFRVSGFRVPGFRAFGFRVQGLEFRV